MKRKIMIIILTISLLVVPVNATTVTIPGDTGSIAPSIENPEWRDKASKYIREILADIAIKVVETDSSTPDIDLYVTNGLINDEGLLYLKTELADRYEESWIPTQRMISGQTSGEIIDLIDSTIDYETAVQQQSDDETVQNIFLDIHQFYQDYVLTDDNQYTALIQDAPGSSYTWIDTAPFAFVSWYYQNVKYENDKFWMNETVYLPNGQYYKNWTSYDDEIALLHAMPYEYQILFLNMIREGAVKSFVPDEADSYYTPLSMSIDETFIYEAVFYHDSVYYHFWSTSPLSLYGNSQGYTQIVWNMEQDSSSKLLYERWDMADQLIGSNYYHNTTGYQLKNRELLTDYENNLTANHDIYFWDTGYYPQVDGTLYITANMGSTDELVEGDEYDVPATIAVAIDTDNDGIPDDIYNVPIDTTLVVDEDGVLRSPLEDEVSTPIDDSIPGTATGELEALNEQTGVLGGISSKVDEVINALNRIYATEQDIADAMTESATADPNDGDPEFDEENKVPDLMQLFELLLLILLALLVLFLKAVNMIIAIGQIPPSTGFLPPSVVEGITYFKNLYLEGFGITVMTLINMVAVFVMTMAVILTIRKYIEKMYRGA